MVLNLNVRICFKLLEGVVQPPAAYKKCLPILRTWTFWWNITLPETNMAPENGWLELEY